MAIKYKKLGAGGYIMSGFSDLDEAFAEMQKNEDAANAMLFPQQRGVQNSTRDMYYVNIRCPWKEMMIFGEAWSVATAERNELKSYGVERADQLSKENQADYLWSCQNLKDRRARGYVFGKAYSVIEPEGELGDTHVFDLWPISKEAFEEARQAKWAPDVHDRESCPKLRRELELCAAEIVARHSTKK